MRSYYIEQGTLTHCDVLTKGNSKGSGYIYVADWLCYAAEANTIL